MLPDGPGGPCGPGGPTQPNEPSTITNTKTMTGLKFLMLTPFRLPIIELIPSNGINNDYRALLIIKIVMICRKIA